MIHESWASLKFLWRKIKWKSIKTQVYKEGAKEKKIQFVEQIFSHGTRTVKQRRSKMHLLNSVEADNRRCQICQPPPAPQKPFLQKNIEISSRVRRKLNFDFFADDCDDSDHLQIKRSRINLPTTTFLNTSLQQQQQNHINNNILKNSSLSSNFDPPSTTERTTMISPKSNFHQQLNNIQSSDTTNSSENSPVESSLNSSIYSTPDQTEATAMTTMIFGETKKSPIDHWFEMVLYTDS